MSNAFAPIVRARPNPIFGRPVHQGSPPIDYSPILLLKPHYPHLFVYLRERESVKRRFREMIGFSPKEYERCWQQIISRSDSGSVRPPCPPTRISSASEALPPPLDTAPLIRAPEGL